jgi:hypothetical protein
MEGVLEAVLIGGCIVLPILLFCLLCVVSATGATLVLWPPRLIRSGKEPDPGPAIEYSPQERPLVAGVLPATPDLSSFATILQNTFIAWSAAGPVVVKPTRLTVAELTASRAKELDLCLVVAREPLAERVQRSLRAAVKMDRTVLLFMSERPQDGHRGSTPLPAKVKKYALAEDVDFPKLIQLAVTDRLIRDHIRYGLSERQVLELIAANERLRPARSGASDPPSLLPEWGFELVEIPSGWFIMGGHQVKGDPLSPPPGRWVYLHQYHISRYPVTCAQYAYFFNAGGCLDALGPGRPKYWTQAGSDYVRNVHLEEWGGRIPRCGTGRWDVRTTPWLRSRGMKPVLIVVGSEVK